MLAWLAAGESAGRQLSAAWTQALAQQPLVLLQSLLADGVPVASFGAVADALDPGGDPVRQVAMETWIQAASKVATLTPEPVDFKGVPARHCA